MNKILSLLKRLGLWIATIFGTFIVLFIYNPINFVVSILAKIILLIIKFGEFIVSAFNKNKKQAIVNTESFCFKFKKFLISLSTKKRYKGNNLYLKNLDSKVMGSRGSLLYIEIITFILLVLFFAPFALIILNTTKTANQIVENPLAFSGSFEVFLKNLTNILTSDRMRYWNSFFNSLIITSGSLLAIGIFAAMAAWVLVRTKKRYSKFIFLLFLSGMVIPFQVVMLPLVRLLELISVNLGIDMKDTYHGIILVYIGFGAPLSVFMFHGFIKSIPMDIEEAAIIDGCTRPQLFFRIIIPILKPIFVTLLVLNGLWIWNDYLLPSLVIGITGEVRTLPLAVANLAGAYVRQWDLLLTSVLLAAIPVIILFLFAQKFIIKGMTSGAIK
ncbi:MAG: carbohydrate ABC transporter permease [Candidatus Izemoplasmatales bacterium]|nr:carbohydrate ABC transporter permease [Candidatus Izemoplasmatales bacterium]